MTKIREREPKARPGREEIERRVTATLERLTEEDFGRRLWEKDLSIWRGDDETRKCVGNRLGWLGAASVASSQVEELREFAAEVAGAGFTDAALLGMGGSSLAPYVFSQVFGAAPGHLRLHVLDTTDPDMLSTFLSDADLARTLFLLASKSGTTIEPLSQFALFRRLLQNAGLETGPHFVALTDEGSPLEETARSEGFRRLFKTPEDVGGRYSALTYFGMLPAALLGLDVRELAVRAQVMEASCGVHRAPSENVAVELGVLMAEAAQAGRDKLTVTSSDQITPFLLWLEQLVAESTGKQGKAVLPIVSEKPSTPGAYGGDRLFVILRLAGDRVLKRWAAELDDAGHLVREIVLEDAYDLGGEFVRWELATATAGAVLGVNPFDEPNVSEAKALTGGLLEKGALRVPDATFDAAEVHLSPALGETAPGADLTSPRAAMDFLVDSLRQDEYFALLAYLPSDGRLQQPLERCRLAIRDRLGVATALEYGPRYLHSTGQAYKGGPNTGVFLILTRKGGADLAVPGAGYTFAQLQLAQARGDFEALGRHGRRAMWLHLASADSSELADIAAALEGSLA